MNNTVNAMHTPTSIPSDFPLINTIVSGNNTAIDTPTTFKHILGKYSLIISIFIAEPSIGNILETATITTI